MPARVSLRNVSKSFPSPEGGLRVLDHLSFDVGAGERVAVLGPSGCGKTTLLRIIAGLARPDAGDMFVDGGEAPDPSVGMAFQTPGLLPWLTALDNVTLPSRLSGRRDHDDAARELLARFGIGEFAEYFPHQLSGGMQARVSIARALLMGPSLLLLDEPFSALDEITRAVMQDYVVDVTMDRAITVIFVTHSVAEAVVLGDRVVTLTPRPGMIASDSTIALACDPVVRRDSIEAADIRRTLRHVLTQGGAAGAD